MRALALTCALSQGKARGELSVDDGECAGVLALLSQERESKREGVLALLGIRTNHLCVDILYCSTDYRHISVHIGHIGLGFINFGRPSAARLISRIFIVAFSAHFYII